MRGNSHVRFGGRAEETARLKGPHRASARPNHTAAILLLGKGVHPKVVSELLGHSQVGVTLDLYSHVTSYGAPPGGPGFRRAPARLGCQFGCQRELSAEQWISQIGADLHFYIPSPRSSGDRATVS